MNKKIKKRIDKKYYEAHKHKRKAKDAVRWMLRSKKIVKPLSCEGCMMDNNKLEAHHPDYTKPLDVRWLCKKCHVEEHVKIKQLTRVHGKEKV